MHVLNDGISYPDTLVVGSRVYEYLKVLEPYGGMFNAWWREDLGEWCRNCGGNKVDTCFSRELVAVKDNTTESGWLLKLKTTRRPDRCGVGICEDYYGD